LENNGKFAYHKCYIQKYKKGENRKKLRGNEWIELQNQLQKFVLFDIFDM